MTPLVRRVATRLVKPEWAERVVSPAYDAMRPEQRAQLMAEDPYVFLHVTRSPGDASGISVEGDVTELNAAALEWLLSEGVFTDVQSPALYLYRLRRGDHEQVGVVADVHLSGVETGLIGPHERVQPHRAVHLADHLSRVAVHSSPVAFGYDDVPEVDVIVEQVMRNEPELDLERGDGLHQTVWRVPDEYAVEIEEELSKRRLYIVDGHHRVAAATEEWGRRGNPEDAGFVLGALFPNSQLNVCAFHRWVKDLNGHDIDSLTEAIAASDFSVLPLSAEDPVGPESPGEFAMYVGHRWYHIKPFRRHPAEFDATLLQDRILGPILGIDEASAGGRLDYLPGSVGLEYLMQLTDERGGAAFALHPVLLSQLKAVVDRGQTLPPKSTYFEPKVRSGVFIAPR
ncbi:MAG: DUF1015 family protein [Acidimicrobiales bacterium]